MQKGNREREFEEHIRNYKLLLFKVCHLYAYTQADREDLFQEIVIQLWKAFPSFKGEAKISTWLYRVALNTAISGLRKKKDFIVSYEPIHLPDQLADPDIDADTEEQLRRLYHAIGVLSQVEKALLMLYLEDRSYEEMETILGMSQGNLRVKMSRIKEKLRQLTKTN